MFGRSVLLDDVDRAGKEARWGTHVMGIQALLGKWKPRASTSHCRGRASGVVHRDHLAVDHGFVGQRCQCFYNAGVLAAKILVVAGSKMDASARFERNRSIAIEFELVLLPVCT